MCPQPHDCLGALKQEEQQHLVLEMKVLNSAFEVHESFPTAFGPEELTAVVNIVADFDFVVRKGG